MPGITFSPFFPLKICSCAANQHPAVIQDYYFPVTALILRTTVLDIKRTVAEHFANYLIHIFMDNIYMHDYHITCTITQTQLHWHHLFHTSLHTSSPDVVYSLERDSQYFWSLNIASFFFSKRILSPFKSFFWISVMRSWMMNFSVNCKFCITTTKIGNPT